MNFNDKLDKFKYSYDDIKYIIKKSIKKSMIKIGSGGSDNLIILDDKDIAIKIIPKKINPLLIKQLNNDYMEAEFYKKFTEEFIKPNKTPHIVGLYKRYILEDLKFIFPPKCPSFDDVLLNPNIDESNIKLCNLKVCYRKNLMEKKASILVLENCSTTISDQFELLINKKMDWEEKIKKVKQFISRICFQFLFTFSVIRDEYPDFIHNDMFLRNILGTNEIMFDPDDYIEYRYKSKSYYLPANGLYIKLNDFGYSLNLLDKNSTLENEIENSVDNQFETNNKFRDIYTFFFDLYNGPGLGGQSLTTIVNNNIKDKTKKSQLEKIIKKEIGKYFNYKSIDKIQSKNPSILDWKWNIGESKILNKTVKNPQDYFNKINVFKHFCTLPKSGRIVNIIN
jgi:hypothetical protein